MLGQHENHNSPLVSVIIPAFNSAKFVARAVKSALAQTHLRHEVIVIDDGSTDETRDVLSQFDSHIKYLQQENRGPSSARNAGIKISQGEYICFLDADDVWVANKLEVQLAFMHRNPNVGLVFSDMEVFGEDGILSESFFAKKASGPDIVSQVPIQDAFMRLLTENFIPTITVMVRRECFSKVGLFDEALRSVEDRDMWLRIAANFPIAAVPSILATRYIHSSNISSDTELCMRSRIRVWEKNRRLFSNLVPGPTWDKLLAETYLTLGYSLLAKDNFKKARRAGLTSLAHAVQYAKVSKSLTSYRWHFGLGLIPSTLVGWRVARSLWRVRRDLSSKVQQVVKRR